MTPKGAKALAYHNNYHKMIMSTLTEDIADKDLTHFIEVFEVILNALRGKTDYFKPLLITEFPIGTKVSVVEIKGTPIVQNFFASHGIENFTVLEIMESSDKDNFILKKADGDLLVLDILDAKNLIFTKIYGAEPLSFDTIFEEYKGYADRLKHRIIDSIPEINKALDEDKLVLFEGAQAMMLDINYGTYPYVTSSSPTTGGVTTGAGVSPRKITKGIGVMKAYTTRVGEGPFVTELTDELGEQLRKTGFEYGATTGRPRRCGWLDLVVGKYAVDINGLTDIVITKIDVLSGLDTVKICVAYDIDGKRYTSVPASTEILSRAIPVYEELPGWKEDITQMKNYDELPENCKKYIKRMEEFLGCPISVVSVGPDRSQNIHIREI